MNPATFANFAMPLIARHANFAMRVNRLVIQGSAKRANFAMCARRLVMLLNVQRVKIVMFARFATLRNARHAKTVWHARRFVIRA